MAKRKKRQKRIRFWKAFVFLLLAVLAGTAAFGIRRIKSGEDRPGRNAGPAVLQGAAGRLAADTQDAQAARQEMQEELLTPQGQGDPEEEYAADPKDAPKLRIVLDPGHGGPGITDEQELGAVYRDTCEKYLTLEIAKALGEELSHYGNVEVFYTRKSDTAMTLKERAAYAAAVDADILVSLHLNASKEHNLFGSEVFVSAYDGYYAQGAGLGEEILEKLTDYGFASKGVKTRLGSHGDYYGIIRECKSLGIPALIVEHGYMDEDRDWERMDSAEKLWELGRRDAEGIAACFGLERGRTLAELSEPAPVQPLESPVRPDVTPPEEVWYTTSRADLDTLEITLYAKEPESRLMYYDFSLDGGDTYQRPELWPGGESVTFSVELSEAQETELRVRAYNTYELRTEAQERQP